MDTQITPESVTYTETYRTDCPHGCMQGARVTVVREKRGPVQSIKVTCMGVHRVEEPQPTASRR